MSLTTYADFKWGLMKLMQNDHHEANSALAKVDHMPHQTFWLCLTKQQTHRSFEKKILNLFIIINIWLYYVVIIHSCSLSPAVMFQSLVTKLGWWHKTKKNPNSNLLYHLDDGCCCWFKYHSCIIRTNTETLIHFPVWFIMHPVPEALCSNTKQHQMTALSCFYNQSLQDNILCLVCGADASLCSDHLIHKAVSRKKDRCECLYSPSHRLSHCITFLTRYRASQFCQQHAVTLDYCGYLHRRSVGALW